MIIVHIYRNSSTAKKGDWQKMNLSNSLVIETFEQKYEYMR
jgi:hypothetical protein